MEKLRIEHNLQLSVKERLNRGYIRPYRPVMDDGPSGRAFDTMKEYQDWCDQLPRWLGYHRANDRTEQAENSGNEDQEKD